MHRVIESVLRNTTEAGAYKVIQVNCLVLAGSLNMNPLADCAVQNRSKGVYWIRVAVVRELCGNSPMSRRT